MIILARSSLSKASPAQFPHLPAQDSNDRAFGRQRIGKTVERRVFVVAAGQVFFVVTVVVLDLFHSLGENLQGSYIRATGQPLQSLHRLPPAAPSARSLVVGGARPDLLALVFLDVFEAIHDTTTATVRGCGG